MTSKKMFNEELRCLGGCGEFSERDEVAGFRKAINNSEDGSHTSGNGKSSNKVNGDVRPGTFRYG